MTSDDAVIAVIAVLERLEIPYVLTGSLASNFHGVPRSTRDADFVVDMAGSRVASFARELPPDLALDPQAPFETVTGTTRHIVRLRGSAFVIELFVLSDDEHDRARFGRRLRVQALSRQTWVPSVEDVIVTKLRWGAASGRSKDVEDVRNVIAVSGEHVDWPYVRTWCTRHGTLALLERVLASLPAV
jgi:hypothetical protein